MRMLVICTLAAWFGIAPAMAAPKVKPPTVAQLKTQIKQLTQERDDLKDRLKATEELQQDLAAAQKSRDLARQNGDALQKQLDELKASLAENQSGSDAILKELQQAKADLAACTVEKETLQKSLDEATAKANAPADHPVELPDIIPARALNLNRVTPSVRNVSRGVVVVNVLINESGEVLNTKLIQGLPGNDIDVQKANEACLEAAKRIVFDPARSADGKTKLRVWQAVGFLVN
jgi:hypothetical protein